jgi:hypothetical protein
MVEQNWILNTKHVETSNLAAFIFDNATILYRFNVYDMT